MFGLKLSMTTRENLRCIYSKIAVLFKPALQTFSALNVAENLPVNTEFPEQSL